MESVLWGDMMVTHESFIGPTYVTLKCGLAQVEIYTKFPMTNTHCIHISYEVSCYNCNILLIKTSKNDSTA
jgi:hypothetical protein